MAVQGGIFGRISLFKGEAQATSSDPVRITGAPRGSYTVMTVQLSGMAGDTVTFEATADGHTWDTVRFENLETGEWSNKAEADGLYRATVLGLDMVRVTISEYVAGDIYATAYLVA